MHVFSPKNQPLTLFQEQFHEGQVIQFTHLVTWAEVLQFFIDQWQLKSKKTCCPLRFSLDKKNGKVEHHHNISTFNKAIATSQTTLKRRIRKRAPRFERAAGRAHRRFSKKRRHETYLEEKNSAVSVASVQCTIRESLGSQCVVVCLLPTATHPLGFGNSSDTWSWHWKRKDLHISQQCNAMFRGSFYDTNPNNALLWGKSPKLPYICW